MSNFKTDNELSEMLKKPYIGHEKLMTLIRRYKRAKNPITKDCLREEIFRNNVRFIRKTVIKKTRAFPDKIEDVFHSAIISFFEGLDKFKPNRGFKFHTYIGYWVDKAIYASYVGDNIVNLPRGNFFKKNSHIVDQAKNISLIYLDKQISNSQEDGFRSMMDVLGSKLKSSQNLNEAEVNSKIMELREALSNAINSSELTIIRWKYLCEPNLTYDEIAAILGCCRENIRQVVFRIIWKLKEYMESDGNSIYSRRYAISERIKSKLNISDEEKEKIYNDTLEKRKKNELHSKGD